MRGRGCNFGVVLLRWFGIVSWDCCRVVERAVFFFRDTFWLHVTLLKKVLKYLWYTKISIKMLFPNNVCENFCHAREKNPIHFPVRKVVVIKITNFAPGKTKSHGSFGRHFYPAPLVVLSRFWPNDRSCPWHFLKIPKTIRQKSVVACYTFPWHLKKCTCDLFRLPVTFLKQSAHKTLKCPRQILKTENVLEKNVTCKKYWVRSGELWNPVVWFMV